jgi:hypothetical protein
MSTTVIFVVGGVLFIAITWATIAFGLTRMISLEEALSVERNEVDRLPRATDT